MTSKDYGDWYFFANLFHHLVKWDHLPQIGRNVQKKGKQNHIARPLQEKGKRL